MKCISNLFMVTRLEEHKAAVTKVQDAREGREMFLDGIDGCLFRLLRFLRVDTRKACATCVGQAYQALKTPPRNWWDNMWELLGLQLHAEMQTHHTAEL